MASFLLSARLNQAIRHEFFGLIPRYVHVLRLNWTHIVVPRAGVALGFGSDLSNFPLSLFGRYYYY